MSEGIEVSECEVVKLTSGSWGWGNWGEWGWSVAKVHEMNEKLRKEEHIFKRLNKWNFVLWHPSQKLLFRSVNLDSIFFRVAMFSSMCGPDVLLRVSMVYHLPQHSQESESIWTSSQVFRDSTWKHTSWYDPSDREARKVFASPFLFLGFLPKKIRRSVVGSGLQWGNKTVSVLSFFMNTLGEFLLPRSKNIPNGYFFEFFSPSPVV